MVMLRQDIQAIKAQKSNTLYDKRMNGSSELSLPISIRYTIQILWSSEDTLTEETIYYNGLKQMVEVVW